MKKRVFLIFAAVFLAAVVLLILYGNKRLTVTSHDVTSSNIPEAFDGCVIVQISDLHNARFGKDNTRLLALIEAQQPDYIFVTGDVFDSRHTKLDVSVDFLENAAKIAPLYYSPGNHESRLPEEYAALKAVPGITVLEDESIPLTRGENAVQLVGLCDPSFHHFGEYQTITLLRNLAQEEMYTLVLSHPPELFEGYCFTDADLVFSGHAHGGQFRIPGLGGLYVPTRGFFPKYTEGIHRQDGTTMVVSRGLGNSLFPFRIMNPPDIVTVTLKHI